MPGVQSETQVMALDLAGVAVSAGSACSSGKVEPSHVLRASGAPDAVSGCAIRVSLGWATQEADIEAFVAAWRALYAHKHNIDIEGACEGSLACSTCHVIVAPEWYKKLPPPSEDEQDMLDLAFGLTKTSRLGCQIVITKDLDGLVVSLPKEVRNMMK
jgi:ferredoxin